MFEFKFWRIAGKKSVFVECWLKLMVIKTGFCIVTARICLIPRSFVVSSKSITSSLHPPIFLLFLSIFPPVGDLTEQKGKALVSLPLSFYPPSLHLSLLVLDVRGNWFMLEVWALSSFQSVKTELLFQDERADPGLRILKRTEGRYFFFATGCGIIRCPRKDQVLAR